MPTSHVSATPQLHDALLHRAESHGERIAVTCGDRQLSYAQLRSGAQALAAHLASNGVVRGDRVMIYADNTIETVIAFYGALCANAVAVIVNPLTKRDKLEYLLHDCRPTALITDVHLAGQFRAPAADAASLRTIVISGAVSDDLLHELPAATRWDTALAEGATQPTPARQALDVDLAAIIYTSGSTGDAKGVMLTHRNMLTACHSVRTYLGYRADDVIVNVLPLAFDYGLYQLLMAVDVGARLVLERSFAFPAAVLTIMARERVTVFPLVPTIAALLAPMSSLADFDLSSLRLITSTAANLPPQHITMLRERFPQATVFSMYGLTECKRCTYLPPADLDRKAGSVGIAIPNTELWLVDDQNQRVPTGTVGQLVIRGATVMAGYWEKPEATAHRLRPGPLPGERVLYTGDLCRLDEDGYLYFVARMDDIIKSRGEKVAPKEVEQVLVAIPGVREAAVIGVPDDVLGQAVKAFVVPAPGVTLDERVLRHAAQARLENFMVPKYFAIVDQLPHTDTGKVRKASLA